MSKHMKEEFPKNVFIRHPAPYKADDKALYVCPRCNTG